MTDKLLAALESKWADAMPSPDALANAVQQGVRQALFDYLTMNEQPETLIEVSPVRAGSYVPPEPVVPSEPAKVMPHIAAPPAPPKPPVATTPSPAPNASPAPSPAPAQPGLTRLHTVTASARHGEGTKQDYYVFTLEDEAGRKVLLKFRQNATTQADGWLELLGRFVTALGIQRVSNTEELHGKTLPLNVSTEDYQVISGLDTISKALA